MTNLNDPNDLDRIDNRLDRVDGGTAAVPAGINVLLGIWLLISPWMLAYPVTARNATGNDVICGILIAIIAGIRFANPSAATSGLSWLNFLFGIWLLISPWVLGYNNLVTPFWNNVICGFAVLILAAWSAAGTDRVRDDLAAREDLPPRY